MVLVLSVFKGKKKKREVDGRALKQKCEPRQCLSDKRKCPKLFFRIICITMKTEARLLENNSPGMHVNTQNLRTQTRALGNSKMHKEDNKNGIIYGR